MSNNQHDPNVKTDEARQGRRKIRPAQGHTFEGKEDLKKAVDMWIKNPTEAQ